jgi:hypothetical protein
MNEEKLNRLAECIGATTNEIENYVLDETGFVRYKSISDDEEYYEIEGDRTGLVQYGLAILRAAVAQGENDGSNSIKISLDADQLFDSKTEVHPVAVKITDKIKQPITTATKQNLTHKLFGIAILIGFIAILVFSIYGMIEFIRHVFIS